MITLNIRGFGDGKVNKFGWVRGLCYSESPDILMLQETKLNTVNLDWVRKLWGSCDCDFIQKPKVGKSGGQLIIWDSKSFDATDSFVFDFCIGFEVFGKAQLTEIVGDGSDPWVIGGDFNEVREEGDRLNCYYIESWAKLFNNFIDNCGLIDLPLGGRKFTRNLSMIALERKHSDHCPIVLKDDDKNFGPKPIKVFDEWLEMEGVAEFIKGIWNEECDGGV
ncbi:uncharacterized protein [Rutidosis leptorrhynchoides]|uniref:uncharacterized protein n=1 Tax=Rutidosis leptorrhynchoides TaxID=125765 RepID=UPI003A99EEEE